MVFIFLVNYFGLSGLYVLGVKIGFFMIRCDEDYKKNEFKKDFVVNYLVEWDFIIK